MHVAKSWQVASTYPIEETTGQIPGQIGGVSGGSRIALDGTPPTRAVVRCLGDTAKQLWSRGSNQSMYMAGEPFITHVRFYAVHPRLVLKAHRNLELHPFKLDEGTEMPIEKEASSFKYESCTIGDRAVCVCRQFIG